MNQKKKVNLEKKYKNWVAIKKYLHALLDLLVITPGEIIDYYSLDEVLFLGPDEGTADMMDWASRTDYFLFLFFSMQILIRSFPFLSLLKNTQNQEDTPSGNHSPPVNQRPSVEFHTIYSE